MPKIFALFVAAAALVPGCLQDAPIATDDAGGRDGGRCIECATPPAGCRLVGGDCTRCGTLECDDGGTHCPHAPPECALPAPGCEYQGGDNCTTCGVIVCGVSCNADDEPFPPIDRACTDASECTVVEHQADCCGTLRALGIRADQRVAFDGAESRCRDAFPGCGCASQPTSADDGTVGEPGQAARAMCVEGRCRSTFARTSGETCDPSEPFSCGPGLACCYPCGVAGCEYQCEPACSPDDPGCFDGCIARP